MNERKNEKYPKEVIESWKNMVGHEPTHEERKSLRESKKLNAEASIFNQKDNLAAIKGIPVKLGCGHENNASKAYQTMIRDANGHILALFTHCKKCINQIDNLRKLIEYFCSKVPIFSTSLIFGQEPGFTIKYLGWKIVESNELARIKESYDD